MKTKRLQVKLFFAVLCVAQITLAQVKVDNVGNVGIGNNPLPNTKLSLYRSTTSLLPGATFGLHSVIEDLSLNSTQPLYGAYFQNK